LSVNTSFLLGSWEIFFEKNKLLFHTLIIINIQGINNILDKYLWNQISKKKINGDNNITGKIFKKIKLPKGDIDKVEKNSNK